MKLSLLVSVTLPFTVVSWSSYHLSKNRIQNTDLSAKQKQRNALKEAIDTGVLPASDEYETVFDDQESEVIKGFTDEDFVGVDQNAGGVGLAERSAILISGSYEDGSARPTELKRFSSIRECTSMPSSVLCTGSYTAANSEDEFDLSVRAGDALIKAVAADNKVKGKTNIQINLCGGDETLLSDFLQTVNNIVGNVDEIDADSLTFNSIGDAKFGNDSASVTIVEENSLVFAFGDSKKCYELVEDDVL